MLASDIPDLDLSHPWDITPERACEMAIACEAAAMAVDARITNSEGAGVSTHRGLRAYGNSHGFLGGYPGTAHSISCVVLGAEGEQMQRDYWYSTARDWRELEAAESIGRRSGERAVAPARRAQAGDDEGAGAVQPGHGARPDRALSRRDPRRQPVSPLVVPARRRGIAGVPRVVRAGGAAAPAEGARAARRSTSEGVATRDRELVAGGVLLGYVLCTYSARKLGLKTTGNAGGTHNLLVQRPRPGLRRHARANSDAACTSPS